MQKSITIKKMSDDLFMLQVASVSADYKNNSTHTFFISQKEVESLVRNSLGALTIEIKDTRKQGV